MSLILRRKGFIQHRHGAGFTLIELLVVITIIGILITLVTVAIVPIQRKSRDAKRKAEVNSFLSAISLFKADFKIYPNSTFYLGSYGGSDKEFTDSGVKNPNSNYAIASDIKNTCNDATNGATSTFLNPSPAIGNPGKPTVTELETLPLVMNPGFTSVNNFMICLRYIDRLLADPKPIDAENQSKYQYRVSYDYGDAVVTALLENTNDSDATRMFGDGPLVNGTDVKRYYKGSGVVVRHLDDSSDAGGFWGDLGQGDTKNDGFYLYQCKKDSGDAAISRDNRVTYEPIISGATGYTGNPACQYTGEGLDVIQAY